MSPWRDRLDDGSELEVVRDWVAANYHYLALVVFLGFALYTRILNWGRFVTQGTVLYNGNDPFYHFRSVQFIVNNFPSTMPFDPWTNFALGTANSQFGTLFDQLIAAAALIVGLGNPSEHTIRMVVLFAPAIFGTLTILPAYVISRRLGGRIGGVIGAGVVALSTGALFQQGFVGTADHHIAEALFQALGVLGTMVAVSAAQGEKPVYELFAEREFGAVKRTIGWSLLAGAAVGSYLLVWPPGVLLLGILGVFYFIYLSAVFLGGRSPEHVAIAGAISMSTTGVIALSTTKTLAISATARSLLQPGLAFAVAGGCLFMAWLARTWDDQDRSRWTYPAAVLGVGLALFAFMAVALPTMFEFFVRNVLRVMGLGFGTSAQAATVGEVDPMAIGSLIQFFKLTIFAALGGVFLVLLRQFTTDEPRAEELLVVVWLVFVLLASLTQGRFAYYLTIPVAGLAALLVGRVVDYALRSSGADRIETHQLMTVGAVLLIVLVPLIAFPPTVLGQAPNKGPGSVQGWQPSLDWMRDNTAVPGTYANPDGEPMDFFETVSRTGDFDYPNGAYGIISWWDYGHWITAQAQRIPNANPFQQGAAHAARFLLAQNESAANAVLRARDEDDAKTRFAMIDWKMVETSTFYGGKFFAPPTFKEGVNRSTFYSRIVNRQQLQQGGNLRSATMLVRGKQPYYQTMAVRLYLYHGSMMEPRPIVVQWQGREQALRGGGTFTFGADQTQGPSPVIRQFDTMEAARNYVAKAPSVRQIGGVGVYPTERVPALEHYRLVHVSSFSAQQSGAYVRARMRTVRNANLLGILPNGTTRGGALSWLTNGITPSWTKTFERVDGATIQGSIDGSVPAGTTVRASVRLKPNAGATFTYTQQAQTDANGDFTMTVPYATTGDDEWGVDEGYTNSSVTALGPYNVTTATTIENGTASAWTGQVEVTEGQVLGEDDSPATVTLTEETANFSVEGATVDAAKHGDGQRSASVESTELSVEARPAG